jgi:uncharacterized protein
VTSRQPPRFVLDTNVCLDLFVFGDPRCASLIDAIHARRIQLVTRDDCRQEWQAVLAYPRLRIEDAARLRAMRSFDEWVVPISASEQVPPRGILPRCRDRDDQKFLELAWQADATALLTRDEALLRLARRAQRDRLFAILQPSLWQEALSDER